MILGWMSLGQSEIVTKANTPAFDLIAFQHQNQEDFLIEIDN